MFVAGKHERDRKEHQKMQKVMLIGNLGRDPEVKYSQQGTAIAQFSVVTTDDGRTRAANRKNTRSGLL